MIKMIGFDLDGTLCDSVPLCIEAFSKAVAPYTDHVLTKEEIVSTFGLNEEGMIKAVVKHGWKNALHDFYEYYQNLHDRCTTPFEGICELLLFLKQNHMIVPLITGKGKKSCTITLEKLGLTRMFDVILYGSEQYRCKSDNILYLLETYGIKEEEFFYIGDTIQDIDDCHRIGVTCLSAAWAKESNTIELKNQNSNTFSSVSALAKFLEIRITYSKFSQLNQT